MRSSGIVKKDGGRRGGRSLILLSLDDEDLDRKIIETVLVKEAEHVEVNDILSVLQTLSLSHEESESRSASEILTKIGSQDSDQRGRVLDDSLHKFVRAVNDVVRRCHKSVEKIKGQQLKMVRSYDIFGNSCKSWQLYK